MLHLWFFAMCGMLLFPQVGHLIFTKALSTLMRFQTCTFSLSSKTHRSIRVLTTVFLSFRLSSLKRLKTIELHVMTQVELYAHATKTYACDIFSHRFLFAVFSTVYTNQICMRSRFDPLSRAFSNQCVFDENAQRISVNGRPKRIKMYAFSNENALG